MIPIHRLDAITTSIEKQVQVAIANVTSKFGLHDSAQPIEALSHIDVLSIQINSRRAWSKVLPVETQKPMFQNAVDRFNVDGTGAVTPLDSLRIINFLSRRKDSATLDSKTESPNGLYVDVNGDNKVTALDALQVINEIARRRRQTKATGEQQVDIKKAAPPTKDPSTTTTESINDSAIAQLF